MFKLYKKQQEEMRKNMLDDSYNIMNRFNTGPSTIHNRFNMSPPTIRDEDIFYNANSSIIDNVSSFIPEELHMHHRFIQHMMGRHMRSDSDEDNLASMFGDLPPRRMNHGHRMRENSVIEGNDEIDEDIDEDMKEYNETEKRLAKYSYMPRLCGNGPFCIVFSKKNCYIIVDNENVRQNLLRYMGELYELNKINKEHNIFLEELILTIAKKTNCNWEIRRKFTFTVMTNQNIKVLLTDDIFKKYKLICKTVIKGILDNKNKEAKYKYLVYLYNYLGKPINFTEDDISDTFNLMQYIYNIDNNID